MAGKEAVEPESVRDARQRLWNTRGARRLTIAAMTTTWEDVALPVLRWVSEHEGPGPFGVGQIADALGLPPVTVYSELERADDERLHRRPRNGAWLWWRPTPMVCSSDPPW